MGNETQKKETKVKTENINQQELNTDCQPAQVTCLSFLDTSPVGVFWNSLRTSTYTKQDPVGVLGTKAFLCLSFLGYRKLASFSLHDLP